MLRARWMLVALLFSAHAAAQGGPPTGPYPQRPPYAPPPYPQAPYAPYPQQPYPQQQPSPYPPSPPSIPARPQPSPEPAGYGYGGALGIGVGHLAVDLGEKQQTTAGGLFFHLGGSLFREVATARVRLSGLIGGGSGGYEGMFSGEAWFGGGLTLGHVSQVFARVGLDAYGLKNDELEANTGMLPGMQIGYQLWADEIGFEIAPRLGLTPRTEYEPGDESEGRRHWRKVGPRLGYGGGATVVTRFFFLDASALRLADSDAVTVLDGRLCAVPFHVALCGLGQVWRSIARDTTSAQQLDVPTIYLGGALGIGLSDASDGQLFSKRKPGQ